MGLALIHYPDRIILLRRQLQPRGRLSALWLLVTMMTLDVLDALKDQSKHGSVTRVNTTVSVTLAKNSFDDHDSPKNSPGPFT